MLACQAALAVREAVCTGKEGLSIRAGLHSGEIVSDAPIGGRSDFQCLRNDASPWQPPGRASGAGRHLHQRSLLSLGRLLLRSTISVNERCADCSSRCCCPPLVGMRSAVAAQRFRRFAWPAFVGRDRELALLTKSLRTAQAGAGQIIGIAGVPGAGKSLCATSLPNSAGHNRSPVFETRSQPYGVATPLHPVLELLRSAYSVSVPEITRNRLLPLSPGGWRRRVRPKR